MPTAPTAGIRAPALAMPKGTAWLVMFVMALLKFDNLE
jgi:hypothetical protein